MKRVSLATLAVNAGASTAPPNTRAKRESARAGGAAQLKSVPVSKLTSEQDSKQDPRVQVAFRMEKDAYKELRRMALDEDQTVNDLILSALNQLRSQKGLKKLAT